MPVTQLSDVIVPEVFAKYVIERSAELSAVFQSGVISRDGSIESQLAGGGHFINMPFWKDLDGDDEVLDDTQDITPAKHSTSQDVAVRIARAKAWERTDLSAELAGSDPFKALGDRVATFWNRKKNIALINTLGGVFSAASMAGLVHDISGETGAAANIMGETFIDAQQKLGDAKGRLSAVMMHSATEAQLAKNDLIEYEMDSDGKTRIPYFMGKRVIVDDSLPVSSGVYTTYLFGEGALGYGEVPPLVPVEFDRDSLGNGGQDILVTRTHYVMHPRGIKWAVTTTLPANTDLATGTNWARVYELKNIRIVQFKHKLNQSA